MATQSLEAALLETCRTGLTATGDTAGGRSLLIRSLTWDRMSVRDGATGHYLGSIHPQAVGGRYTGVASLVANRWSIAQRFASELEALEHLARVFDADLACEEAA